MCIIKFYTQQGNKDLLYDKLFEKYNLRQSGDVTFFSKVYISCIDSETL